MWIPVEQLARRQKQARASKQLAGELRIPKQASTFDDFAWKGRDINASVRLSGYVERICQEFRVELEPLQGSKINTERKPITNNTRERACLIILITLSRKVCESAAVLKSPVS